MSPYRSCRVSFVERGQEHSAHVDAQSTFEAAALALKYWRTLRYVKLPRRHATLTVEINKPARLLAEVKVADVLEWLYERSPRSATERARVEYLRNLLADDRH